MALRYRLGIMYDYRREYDAAIAQYQETIALKSDHIKALRALGKVYMKTGNIEKAKDALETAKKVDPNFTEPQELLSNINEEPVAPVKRTAKRHHRHSHGKHGIVVKRSGHVGKKTAMKKKKGH